MKKTQRTERIADLIQMELAKLIQQAVKDPRAQSVTLTGVDVSRDLSIAKIYFTVHDEAKEKRHALEGLAKATGFLRARLADAIDLRVVPNLRFCYDDSLSRGQRMDELLDSL